MKKGLENTVFPAAIFFDLDGTIIDSEKLAAETLIAECANFGIEWDPEDAKLVTGRTWASAFQLLYARHRFPVSVEELSSRVLGAYRKRLKDEVKEVLGAKAAVESLRKEFRLALISGSHREEILLALTALGIREHFEVILGAEDYRESKPSPEGYLKAAQMMNVRPEDCVVFEDSDPGIASGLAAGLTVVAITSTNHFGHDFHRADRPSAHFFIEDLRGVDGDWMRALKSSSVSG